MAHACLQCTVGSERRLVLKLTLASAADASVSFKTSLRSLPTVHWRHAWAIDETYANYGKRLGLTGPLQRQFRNWEPLCFFSIISIQLAECESLRIHNPGRPIAPDKHRQEDLLSPECSGYSRLSQRRIFANYPHRMLYTASCPQADYL